MAGENRQRAGQFDIGCSIHVQPDKYDDMHDMLHSWDDRHDHFGQKFICVGMPVI